MTGKEILQQSLRERCLHKLLTTKYKEEGESYMYWTFFAMLGSCFAQDHHKAIDPPRSFDDCFDWASFEVKDASDSQYIQDCVDDSFKVTGDQESDNEILREDRIWAQKNRL